MINIFYHRYEKVLIESSVTRHIIGYKQEESDNLLKFLYDHIALGQDFQVRVKWRAGDVVVWDVSWESFFLIIRTWDRYVDSGIESCDCTFGHSWLARWPAPPSSQVDASGRATIWDTVRDCKLGWELGLNEGLRKRQRSWDHMILSIELCTIHRCL